MSEKLFLEKRLSRREMIHYGGLAIVGTGLLSSLGCAQTALSSAAVTAGNTDGAIGTDASGKTCAVIPSETAGPYPAHDDSAINVLRFNGIVRSDIRNSLTGASGYAGTATATGVPLTMNLNLVNVNGSCAPLAGYVIYLWHCDINGKYSMYSSGVTNQTYLRGVQQTDAAGAVSFTSIFPGCYDGRMPHVHVEIYPSVAQAVDDAYIVRTSQFTFPLATCNAVYNNASGYQTSVTNLSKISYATDNVFADGTSLQMASVTAGTYSTGLTTSLTIGIKS